MIRYFLRKENKPLKEINHYQADCWINMVEPSEKELLEISKKLRIDIGYLKDAMDPFEVPRLEVDNRKLYLFTRTPFFNNGNLSSTPILFIISKNFLVTITQKKLTIFDNFINHKISFSTIKRIKFFIQIMSEMNNIYNSSLISINKNIYHASSNIEKIDNKDVAQFVRYEQISNDFLSRLIQTNSVLNNLLINKTILLDEEEREMLGDLLLSNGQLIDISKNSLNTVKNLRDSYSTILTNNLNRTIKLLTSLTIVLNIPTMIAGLWGMNVGLPFAEFKFAFFVILGITSLICLSLIIVFNKNDWL